MSKGRAPVRVLPSPLPGRAGQPPPDYAAGLCGNPEEIVDEPAKDPADTIQIGS